MTPRVFSIPFLLILIGIWICLFIDQKIAGRLLCSLLLVSIIMAALMYNFENISSIWIDTKNQKYLIKMNEIKNEVFAEADSVRKIAEAIAELEAFSVTSVGRLASDDLERRMLDSRDRIKAMLKEARASQSKINKIADQIDQMIIFDLSNDCVQASYTAFRETHPAEIVNQKRDSIYSNLWERIKQATKDNSLKEYMLYLKQNELYSGQVQKCIDNLQYFLDNKKLK